MPPKKKAKAAAAASTPTADGEAMVIDTPQPQKAEEPRKPAYDILKDPWTDEQETSLFKGIIKWKPAGKLIGSYCHGTVLTIFKACTSTSAWLHCQNTFEIMATILPSRNTLAYQEYGRSLGHYITSLLLMTGRTLSSTKTKADTSNSNSQRRITMNVLSWEANEMLLAKHPLRPPGWANHRHQ
jgi:hypothetical protein